jgi:hypothetical protein
VLRRRTFPNVSRFEHMGTAEIVSVFPEELGRYFRQCPGFPHMFLLSPPRRMYFYLLYLCVSKKAKILLANSKSLSFSALIFGKAQERLD